MLTLNAIDMMGFVPTGVTVRSRTRSPRHSAWLAAAAMAQSNARLVLADPDADLRRMVELILDSWTSLALATLPIADVPSDMTLVEHADGLLARHGVSAGERARTWVELSTLLVARRRGGAQPFPLRCEMLAAHIARLGTLIATPRLAPPTRKADSLGLVLLSLAALLLMWLAMSPLVDVYNG